MNQFRNQLSKLVLCLVPFMLGTSHAVLAQQANVPQKSVRKHKISAPKVPARTRSLLLHTALQIQETDLDCSHLVHYLYDSAGLYYNYEPSKNLYMGSKDFRRVYHPQPGDLIVWQGHVGIVVDPRQHSFISSLNSGVKVSSYVTSYWKRRGNPRFFQFAGPHTPPFDLAGMEAVARDDWEPSGSW
jgi:cell wall-associated NlpC family hydrolase